MRIGITYTASQSIFSSGRGQTSLNLAKALETPGNTIDFIRVLGSDQERLWWDDVPSLPHAIVRIEDISAISYEVLIDVDGFLSVEDRTRIAKHTILFYRKTFIINEIENAVYNHTTLPLNLIGSDAVWMWDEMNPGEKTFLAEVLPIPVFFIPYLWSPWFLEEYCKGTPPLAGSPLANRTIFHLLDKNSDNQSNSIVPLVACSSFLKEQSLDKQKYRVRLENSLDISDNTFFRRNIWYNSVIQNNNEEFVEFSGRSRIADWDIIDSSNTQHIAVSHIRFSPFKHFMLDAAWLGIKHVHNSRFLANLHPALARFYYEESEVDTLEAKIALATKSPEISPAELANLREFLTTTFSPESHRQALAKALADSLPAPTKLPDPIQLTIQEQNSCQSQELQPGELPGLEPGQSTEQLSSTYQNEQSHPKSDQHLYKVLFVDFWVNFEPTNNFFVDMFKYYNLPVQPLYPESDEIPDLIICGPFEDHPGKNRQSWPASIPRIYFTGESQIHAPTPYEDESIKLFLSFNVKEDDKNIRLPLWVLFLDWFNTLGTNPGSCQPCPSPSSSPTTPLFTQFPRNPGLTPIKFATDPHPIPIKDRPEFCSFVVSNASSNIRNLFFKKANEFKKVNSGGHAFNNIGAPLFSKGAGGAEGEAIKLNFLQKHRFNICFENHSESGYITEKLLHAKLAGCVPLYWGDPDATIDFNENSFVNMSGMNLRQMMSTLIQLEENPITAAEIASTPALSQEDVQVWYEKFKRITEKCRQLMLSSLQQSSLPISQANPQDSPVIVSYIDESTQASALKNLKIGSQFLQKNLRNFPGLTYILYHLDNLDLTQFKSELCKHSFIQYRPINKHTLSSSYNIPFSDDFWRYKNYGWRLILLNETSTTLDLALKGRTILFAETGMVYINIPHFLTQVPQESPQGCLFLRDPYVTNSQWCLSAVNEKLEPTPADLSDNYIFPDLICFKNNHIIPKALFKECLDLERELGLATAKTVVEINSDNEIVGNPHDAILYSLLLRKYKLPNFFFTDIFDRISMYSAIKNQKPIYCHSGKFLEIHRLFANIDDIQIINLERRPDRLEELYKSFSTLVNFSTVFKAVDGKKLEMTPALNHLFRSNDFDWKKSVMGCALSHMELWRKLATCTVPFVNNYLILEDDVRFDMTMMDKFANSMKNLPSDTWDILYLGGVLPCNRETYPEVLEPVKAGWHRIKSNPCFSPSPSTPLKIFHHCLYSYVLSRRGAQKLLRMIEEKGIWTSMDHLAMALNENGGEIYVHFDSVTYSYQEEDDDYLKTEYDNFGRVVKYDSDIWNNTEKF